MYQLIIKPRAVSMMQEAYRWYEDRNTDLGEDFLNAANNVFSKLAEHPEYCSSVHLKYRQIRLSRFSYVVTYRTPPSEIVVLAVFHTSRNPSEKLEE